MEGKFRVRFIFNQVFKLSNSFQCIIINYLSDINTEC